MMKSKILGVLAVFGLMAAGSAWATPAVPEIDAATGVSAIALLAGVVALLAERRRRSQSGS
ncbi:MAG: VPEID-CTERM sorting domain-containing protein [Candidatus Methylumidiphilus sp.]